MSSIVIQKSNLTEAIKQMQSLGLPEQPVKVTIEIKNIELPSEDENTYPLEEKFRPEFVKAVEKSSENYEKGHYKRFDSFEDMAKELNTIWNE